MYLHWQKKRIKKRKILEASEVIIKRLLNIECSHTVISLRELQSIKNKYDIALCYHIHSPIMIKYVATKIDARKKIGWIHNDFSTTGFRVQGTLRYLNRFDELVAVSTKVKDEFIRLCPKYIGDVSVAHNIVNVEEIITQSSQIPNDAFFFDSHVKILSVGRFTTQKGFDLAIEVAKILRNKGVSFHWYLIGYGEDEGTYRKMIDKYKLDDIFIILGKKTNPYPYIANCDIYVQPSRHEAWGLAVHEARILHKPILVSNFAGSNEQIIDHKTGYIVPIIEQDKFVDQLEKLILNPDDRERLEKNLKIEDTLEEDLRVIMSKFN